MCRPRAPRASGPIGRERRLAAQRASGRELSELRETLRAPVVTSYMGKGAFPEDHELSAELRPATRRRFWELVEGADAVSVVGSELGAETTQQYALHFLATRPDRRERRADRRHLPRPRSRRRRAGDTRRSAGAPAEAGARRPRGGARSRRPGTDRLGPGRAGSGARARPSRIPPPRPPPPHAAAGWDMTILAYWAGALLPVQGRAVPATRSAREPLATPGLRHLGGGRARAAALAVAGDGGFLYGVQELATARQYGVPTTSCSSTTAVTGFCGSTSATPMARPSRSTSSSQTSPGSRVPSTSRSSRRPRMRSGSAPPGSPHGRARGGPAPRPPRDVDADKLT